LSGHAGVVEAVGWSPDGGRVMSGGTDGSVRIWDVGRQEEVLRLISAFDGEFATWWPTENRVGQVSPEAWRFLRAACYNAEGRLLGLQPYESCYPPTSTAALEVTDRR
jgi:WD40 repeat protein